MLHKASAVIVPLVLLLFLSHCADEPNRITALPTSSESAAIDIHTAPVTNGCVEGQQPSGALYRICMPSVTPWNGDLLVYAHGYVSPFDPLALPTEADEIAQAANELGYAFATSSYRVNGLAIRQGMEDLLELVGIFESDIAAAGRVYLTGASEGGIITALSVEQHPEVYAGGLAICGPVGDFQDQLNYLGDFWVVFGYFFPGVIPGDPISGIPQEVIDNWDTVYAPRVRNLIRDEPDLIRQLLRVTHAPTDRRDPATVEQTVLGVLWYSVFTMDDAKVKLGGQPFDNTQRIYRGSGDDRKLNREVARYAADSAAAQEVREYYQTTGQLPVPLVTMHTTGDPIIPYWHERLYRQKARRNGSARLYTNIPTLRYGHCTQDFEQTLAGFQLLVRKVTGNAPDPDLALQVGLN